MITVETSTFGASYVPIKRLGCIKLYMCLEVILVHVFPAAAPRLFTEHGWTCLSLTVSRIFQGGTSKGKGDNSSSNKSV